MIVDHFNTLLGGGAALAARRIHEGLREAGLESRFWYRGRHAIAPPDDSYHVFAGCDPDAAIGSPWRKVFNEVRHWRAKRELKRALAGRPAGLELFSASAQGRPTAFAQGLPDGDVLHLHWLSRWIDFPSFFASIPDDYPIVWTLHDMNPMTGGCHYAGDCPAFRTGCGECPQLGQRGADDLARRGFDVRKLAYVGKNLHVVALSRWMEQQARESALFAAVTSIRRIPNGIDTEDFSPCDQAESRDQLGVSRSAIVIAFAADAIDNPRKGLKELLAAVSLVDSPSDVTLLICGRGEIPDYLRPSRPVRSLGFVSDPRLLARFYSAADLFVLPSLHENLATSGLESLACGTPVVGFDTGGNADFILPNETGLLARAGDVADLARQIRFAIERPELRREWSANARRLALREFHGNASVRRYIELYEEVVDSPPQQAFDHEGRIAGTGEHRTEQGVRRASRAATMLAPRRG